MRHFVGSQMSSTIDLLRQEYTAVASQVQSMGFIPRDSGLQDAALNQAREFIGRLNDAKNERVSRRDEAEANEILFMERALSAVTLQLQMCICLKADDGEAAWSCLVDAQSACADAIRVRKHIDVEVDAEKLENLRASLDAHERMIFPPQVFFSIGGRARERECSICSANYNDCNHIKGRAYMGEICYTIVKGLELDEISLVDNPDNKHARLLSFEDGGRKRNKMTGRQDEASGSGV